MTPWTITPELERQINAILSKCHCDLAMVRSKSKLANVIGARRNILSKLRSEGWKLAEIADFLHCEPSAISTLLKEPSNG